MTLLVELFSSPGCRRCDRAQELLREVIAGLEGASAIEWRRVNVVAELEYAARLGVVAVPAIAIDGRLLFTGLPSRSRLREELQRRLPAGAGSTPRNQESP